MANEGTAPLWMQKKAEELIDLANPLEGVITVEVAFIDALEAAYQRGWADGHTAGTAEGRQMERKANLKDCPQRIQKAREEGREAGWRAAEKHFQKRRSNE